MAEGEGHSNYAASLRSQAMVHHEMGDHAAALPLLLRGAIYRAALGEDHPESAGNLNSLAVVHEAMGNYTAALPLYQRALEIHRARSARKARTMPGV